MISVVVPTYNRADLLETTLASLAAQEGISPLEIVVVDNNSKDDTRMAVKAFAKRAAVPVRYAFEPQQGSSAARNAGIRAARGEIIAFVDDDVIAQPGWLSALVETYTRYPDAWCVGGKTILRLPEPIPVWFDANSNLLRFFLSFQDFGGEIVRVEFPLALSTANFSVRRDALQQVGLFDTRLGRFDTGLLCGEDVELCYRIQRAGGRVYYRASAVVVHLIPTTRMTKRFFRERAYGEGQTDSLLHSRKNGALQWGRTGREVVAIVKDWGKATYHYGRGNPRRAFICELAGWKRFGYMHQALQLRASGPVGPRSRVTVGPYLTVEVHQKARVLTELKSQWDDLVEASGVSIFQSSGWLAAWCNCFVEDRALRVLVAQDAAGYVGALPLFLESVRSVGIPVLRRVRIVGSGHADYLDLLVRPGQEAGVALRFAEQLVAMRSEWDVLDLEDVPESSKTTPLLVRALEDAGCRVTRGVHHRCFAIALPGSFDDYVRTLRPNTRKKLLWEMRKLDESGFRVEEINEPADLEGALQHFISLHQGRWSGRGQSGAFSDPRTQQFHSIVAREFHRQGWLKLTFLARDGQRIAGEIGYLHGRTTYSYLTALDASSPWAKYSPGAVLTLKSIKRTIESGADTYDLLRGTERYKQTLGATGRINWRYTVIAPHVAATMRSAIWNALSAAGANNRRAMRAARTALRRLGVNP